MLPKPVSKGSFSCQRSLTLAALAGHQRHKKKTVMLFILAHLKLAMGIMHLKRCSCGIKTNSGAHMSTHWSYLETGKTHSKGCGNPPHTQSAHSRTSNRFSYLGLAAGKHWGGQSCSARHWQPCQHSVLSGHHVHCRSGRSPRGRCPSDCSPPGPWMSTCYMGARREERDMLINCHITCFYMLSFIPVSLMVCDKLSVFLSLSFFMSFSMNSLPFYVVRVHEFEIRCIVILLLLLL